MRRLHVLLLAFCALQHCSCAKPIKDDGTLLAQQKCKTRRRTAAERRECVKAYLQRKAAVASAAPTMPTAGAACPDPTDDASTAQRLQLDACLHAPEVGGNATDWLRAHIVAPPPTDATSCRSDAATLEALLAEHGGDAAAAAAAFFEDTSRPEPAKNSDPAQGTA